ncbi:DUF58 domain-containing protein [Paracoccus siganidrum]|uniref:DUF58 domain-containing protein n=1 Tax=Paracoccus siganidrum TaxID=1276757 RepID=A0A419A9E8_9RHOB|nr:DUF58 domain-containing protein [Paracoccus siganidrum]
MVRALPEGAGQGAADPAGVSTASLMALEPLAARDGREAVALAERPGTTATRRRGQGHEIREIRPFADGDDPRHIDAAATARSGSPQVRSFHEDRERSLLLIADFRRPMLWGTASRLRSVAVAEMLALAGWRAALQGGAVGVVALTDAGPDAQPPRPRHRGMALAAACLARAHAAALAAAERAAAQGREPPVRPLAPDLVRAARQAPPGAGIVLATALDDPGEDLDAALAALSARGPLRLILIEDRFETAPPAQPLPYAAPQGAAFARFSTLPAGRAARAARLSRPGIRVQRVSSDPVARGGGQ